jgi:hypothetical protein
VVIVLAGLNLRQGTARPDGPDPAEEALHSPTVARRECRVAIESHFSGQDFEFVTPLVVEYLQGGEYEVRATVALTNEGRRASRQTLCEIQFSRESGWVVDQILVDGR